MAFHPYPQLIPAVFNRHGFGPPCGITRTSAWPWVDHLVSGLSPATGAHKARSTPYSDSLSLRLRRSRLNLATDDNSPVHYARGTPSPCSEEQWAPTGCRHTVSGTISLPFRGAFHLSLTVLVHYRSLRVFSLGEWSPRIHSGYHVPGATWDNVTKVEPSSTSPFAYGAITLYGFPFQGHSAR